MSLKIKDLPFTDFYKKVNNLTKKIQKVVFPNRVEIGASSEYPADLRVYGAVYGPISGSDGSSFLSSERRGGRDLIEINSGTWDGGIRLSTAIGLLSGSADPEGNVTGSVGDIYTENLGNGTLWFKRSGTNTTAGWGQIGPERVMHRSQFILSTGEAGNEVWIPWRGTLDSTSMTFDHMLLMPTSGRIERITIVADQALNSSCDVEIHRAPDGSPTFSQIDSDLSMDLSVADTAAQSNSISVEFNQYDRIAVNFQSSTVALSANVLVMLEIVYD